MFTEKNPFQSFHGDVLGANPKDEEGKKKLIEELKNRAR